MASSRHVCERTILNFAQEQHRQGQAVAGDLVLITGAGQHSAGSPVLRGSVHRLLTSLQLAPSGGGDGAPVSAAGSGGSDSPAGGVGQAFSGYARFSGRRQPAPQSPESPREAAAGPPLVDTGLRPRHGGFSADGLAAGAAGNVQNAAQQWSHANAVALTEAIVLDWCASSRHAWGPATAGGPSPAAQPIHCRTVVSRGGVGGSGGGTGGQQRQGQPNTTWMDTAMQRGWQAAGAGTAVQGAATAGSQLQSAVDTASQQGAGNAGRLVVPNAVLLRWLQSKDRS